MSELEPTSQLASFIALREKLVTKQILRLRVPRWENPEIVVTYDLLDQGEYSQAMSVIYEFDSKKPEDIAKVSMDANLDVLVKTFKSIEIKGDEVNASADSLIELAELLGLEGEDKTARRTLGKLFVADGDILATAQRVVAWSGFSNQEVAEGFSGE